MLRNYSNFNVILTKVVTWFCFIVKNKRSLHQWKIYSYCSEQFITLRTYQCIKYIDSYSTIITLNQLIT